MKLQPGGQAVALRGMYPFKWPSVLTGSLEAKHGSQGLGKSPTALYGRRWPQKSRRLGVKALVELVKILMNGVVDDGIDNGLLNSISVFTINCFFVNYDPVGEMMGAVPAVDEVFTVVDNVVDFVVDWANLSTVLLVMTVTFIDNIVIIYRFVNVFLYNGYLHRQH
ncbi:hypothetical protein NDU88_000549 [Pleurodeles waltl]|uniref:Uncharacterized protein n=1 Tax=Pleurodeles waltl TaxID=8319 RepID=A0AAV7LX48_PLEWA|nr:hypothetical protein NDU88_000549 [Pleurodeles waltl]